MTLRVARMKQPPYSHVSRLEYMVQPVWMPGRMARGTKQAGPATKARRKRKVLEGDEQEASSLVPATAVRVMWVLARMHLIPVSRQLRSRRRGGGEWSITMEL
jgi:hypothetical protein